MREITTKELILALYCKTEWTQAEIARDLGITNGQVSKAIRSSFHIRKVYDARMRRLDAKLDRQRERQLEETRRLDELAKWRDEYLDEYFD